MADDLPPIGTNAGRLIESIRRGGSTEHGEKAQFELMFEDGVVEVFRVSYLNLPHLISSLRSIGNVVHQHREGHRASDLDVVVPYRVREASVGQSTAGTIVIQFAMEEGIPLSISMNRTLAEKLLQDIQSELGQKPPKPGNLQ